MYVCFRVRVPPPPPPSPLSLSLSLCLLSLALSLALSLPPLLSSILVLSLSLSLSLCLSLPFSTLRPPFSPLSFLPWRSVPRLRPCSRSHDSGVNCTATSWKLHSPWRRDYPSADAPPRVLPRDSLRRFLLDFSNDNVDGTASTFRGMVSKTVWILPLDLRRRDYLFFSFFFFISFFFFPLELRKRSSRKGGFDELRSLSPPVV